METAQGMSVIVKTVTRFTVGLILLFGLYMIYTGHLTPGGGLAGGVIITLSYIHLMLAYGGEAVLKKLDTRNSMIGVSVTGITALLVLFLNIFGRQYISGDWIFLASDITIAMEFSLGFFIVFLVLVYFSPGYPHAHSQIHKPGPGPGKKGN